MSALTFWRNRTPRPRWVGDVTMTTDEYGRRTVTGSVVNRGRGAALEVKFEPEDAGIMGLFARQEEERAEFGKKLDITMRYGPEDEGDGVFVLSWVQEPDLHKTRKKRLKFELRATGDPNTREGRRLRQKL